MNPKNIKVFHPSPPSYLLKVTKFLVKIHQFALLVMTEQSILVYKLFLSDLSLFFYLKIASSPWKKSPPLSQQAPCKNWGPSSPPHFWTFGRRFNAPTERGEGTNYACFAILLLGNRYCNEQLFEKKFGSQQCQNIKLIKWTTMKQLFPCKTEQLLLSLTESNMIWNYNLIWYLH